MSFRGELREFELPDIMQLIASQRKAGWLKVMAQGQTQFVFFRDGKITSTKNPTEENDPFEEYIGRKGILTADQTDRVAAIRRKTGMDVQDILLKEGLLDEFEIQELFEAMVEEDIFDLMTIRSGTYEFETEERLGPLPEGALSADIGPILMEGARKADEIAEMRGALGPEDGVLVLTPAGRDSETSFDEERLVLSLVNGVRTIETIIDESGLDRYTATRILFDCARKGWVGLLRRSGAKRTTEETVTGEFNLPRTLRWIAPVLAFLLTSVLFSDVLQRFRNDDPFLGEWLKRSSQLREADRREAVHTALEVYRVKAGRYPDDLGALPEEGLLPASILRDGDRDRWAYAASPNGDEFVLVPAPPRPADGVD